MQRLQISLDNGVTWVYATNVRVIASDPDVADEVHLEIDNVGIKAEVVCDRKVVGSETKPFFDIILALE